MLHRKRWICWGVAILVFLTTLGLGFLLAGPLTNIWLLVGWFLVSTLLAGLAYWIVTRWLALVETRRGLTHQLDELESQLEANQKRLNMVLQLNNQLADATDEASLMEGVLSLFSSLVGATGSAYIPMDHLGQPLAIQQHGKIPEKQFNDWYGMALSPEVQARCRSCTLRHAAPSADCPLHRPTLFGGMDIYCLPLSRDERMLGMVYLYLPSEKPLEPEMGIFLEGLLGEIVLAIDTLRIHVQETSTLRQLQLVRSPQKDLHSVLQEFIENAQHALEADYAMIWLHGDKRTRSMQVFGCDNSDRLDTLAIDEVIQKVYQTKEMASMTVAEQPAVFPPGVKSLLAAPVTGPDSSPVGVMLVANEDPAAFFPRQQRVLQTLTTQVAVLVENERFILDLEYRTVMDERIRLAREIHDGLAQTLAFLKLQSAQMQAYIKDGDLERLGEAIETTHKTLSDVYLDTRQAIDNLRVTPKEGIRAWLTQAAEDFTEATRIKTTLSITIDPMGLPPEVQAQLLRVVQEALSNIRKHSRAREVTLSLYRWQEDIILEVGDDGQGFSPDDVPTISQYGLRGMRERAELIGADFQIISSLANGTTVRLRLPYRLEETSV